MPSVQGFKPSTNAPLFGNGPWPAGTSLTVQILPLPPVTLNATGMGLCGGMSFLARDIFEAGSPQLRNRVAARIPLPLAQHVLQRLIHSFDGPATIARWIWATQSLDHDTFFRGAGLYRVTVAEAAAVMRDVDAGALSPIGVVLVQSWGPWAVFENHVELIWRYELSGSRLTLYAYDCNAPGRDDITIELDISAPAPAKPVITNGTDGPTPGRIRGFFRLPYNHVDPSPAYIDDGVVSVRVAPPATIAPSSVANVTVDARNTGSTTWTPVEGYRLGSQRPQDSDTWGTNRVELPVRSVDPEQTTTFKFPIAAPKTVGEFEFAWRMVHELVRWFGTTSPPLQVAVGTGISAQEQLHRQHLRLRRGLDESQMRIQAIDWGDALAARYAGANEARVARALEEQLMDIEEKQAMNGYPAG